MIRCHPATLTRALTALLTAAPCAGAQQVIPLPPAVGTASEGFSEVFDVLPLGDGRLLLTDSKEGTLHRVDLRTGRSVALGRNGDGPGEFRSAYSLLEQPGTARRLLWDPRGRRLVALTPDGTPERTIGADGLFTGDGSVSPPFALDADGALLFVRERFDAERQKMDPEARIMRWEPTGRARPSQVATLQIDRPGRDEPGIPTMRFRDAVAMRPDGLLARVGSDPYEVTWLRGGRELGRTGPLGIEEIPVTAAIRAAYIDSVMHRSSAGNLRFVARNGARAPSADPATRARFAPFPERMPPIPTWGRVALFDPEGRLWVNRTTDPGAQEGRVDVFVEGRGRVATVTLPPRARVAGFAGNLVVIVRADDDDLQSVSGHPMPRLP